MEKLVQIGIHPFLFSVFQACKISFCGLGLPRPDPTTGTLRLNVKLPLTQKA
jgi:hypothetical protein